MSYKIDPNLIGKVPITVMAANKTCNRYCVIQDNELQIGDPEGPMVPVQPETMYLTDTTSAETVSQDEEDEEYSINFSGYTELYWSEEETYASHNNMEICSTALIEDTGLLPIQDSPFTSEDWMLEKEDLR